ncbi:GHKL domain-containing protein [Parageobacillus sp. VR-IP]|uniref:ATP-binding protein n=2 Tax=Parageobacillus sp. VR-IP TaxID=2742205 RepID=UPI0015840A8A|nr:ATP-binding protein [Parageobacillus sp. VR-IP]NUK30692.1 GHKL domain-containing protein [Parageobacillus sp. VR-IP]
MFLDIVKNVLLNLFFILIPVFILALWLEERNAPEKIRKYILTLAFAIIIILCMTFPINPNIDAEYIYDLHQVPLWLGSLYKGPIASFFLCMVTIGYHSFFGGKEFMLTAITSVAIMIAGIALSKKFLALSSKQRILLAFLLSAVSEMLMVVLIQSFHHTLPASSAFWLYLPIQPISMIFTCYLKEILYKNSVLRKRIIRAEKMEVVSHLAASISHEVRNPLTTARGFIQLLEQSHLTQEKRKQYIRIAIEELDRAQAIITDYLTFAKPAPESVENLNVKTEIERVIDIVRPLANMNSVEVQTSLIPCNVKGERQKLQQCLLNIIKNAIEAMPNGGTLEVYISIEKDQVLIRISDTGVGMTKEQIERLGEPYFTTKGRRGTGLGMMVVYRIIESMGGTIQIASEVNKGTQVSLYLPLTQSLHTPSVEQKRDAFVAL